MTRVINSFNSPCMHPSACITSRILWNGCESFRSVNSRKWFSESRSPEAVGKTRWTKYEMTVKSEDFFGSLRFCSFYETTKMSFYDLRFRSKQFPDGSLKNISSWYFWLFWFFFSPTLIWASYITQVWSRKFLHNRKPIIRSVSRRGKIP